MNDVIRAGARAGLGLGEAIGRAILTGDFRTRTSASWPPASAWACRSRSTSASATTSSTSTPTATAPPSARPATTISSIFAQAVTQAGRRRPAQLRHRRHGAGSVPQGAGDGPQRRPPGGPTHRQLHDRRFRPDPARRRHRSARRRRATRATTTARGRRSWSAPSPTAARASTCRATTAPPCRIYITRPPLLRRSRALSAGSARNCGVLVTRLRLVTHCSRGSASFADHPDANICGLGRFCAGGACQAVRHQAEPGDEINHLLRAPLLICDDKIRRRGEVIEDDNVIAQIRQRLA